MPLLTSDTHPIRLDILPAEVLATPGRLGLTFAPGKKAPGVHGRWDRDLATDLTRLRDHDDVTALVNLMEPHELETLQLGDYPAAVAQAGIAYLALPIPDAGVPADPDDAIQLVRTILARLHDAQTVAIHCRGGLGRTGLIAAAALTATGIAPDAAIRHIRHTRPGAIENPAQERAVHTLARSLTPSP